jgi:hypothetical protein
LKKYYPEEWLLPLEMLEILAKQIDNSGLTEDIIAYLHNKEGENEDMQKLIGDGLLLITGH